MFAVLAIWIGHILCWRMEMIVESSNARRTSKGRLKRYCSASATGAFGADKRTEEEKEIVSVLLAPGGNDAVVVGIRVRWSESGLVGEGLGNDLIACISRMDSCARFKFITGTRTDFSLRNVVLEKPYNVPIESCVNYLRVGFFLNKQSHHIRIVRP
jgi:hypothetical protein